MKHPLHHTGPTQPPRRPRRPSRPRRLHTGHPGSTTTGFTTGFTTGSRAPRAPWAPLPTYRSTPRPHRFRPPTHRPPRHPHATYTPTHTRLHTHPHPLRHHPPANAPPDRPTLRSTTLGHCHGCQIVPPSLVPPSIFSPTSLPFHSLPFHLRPFHLRPFHHSFFRRPFHRRSTRSIRSIRLLCARLGMVITLQTTMASVGQRQRRIAHHVPSLHGYVYNSRMARRWLTEWPQRGSQRDPPHNGREAGDNARGPRTASPGLFGQ